jgi:hypothetical protein
MAGPKADRRCEVRISSDRTKDSRIGVSDCRPASASSSAINRPSPKIQPNGVALLGAGVQKAGVSSLLEGRA